MQRQWLEQQMREKENQKRLEKEEQNLYDQQTLELTKLRGVLEYDFLQKKKSNEIATIHENLNKADEKRQMTEQESQQKLWEERQKLQQTIQRGAKQPYPGF